VSERKKGGGGTTALQGSHQTKKDKNGKKRKRKKCGGGTTALQGSHQTKKGKNGKKRRKGGGATTRCARLSLQTTLLTPLFTGIDCKLTADHSQTDN
jgi:hypothetical protein